MGVKFVPKAGGHSLWSTIGAEGIVIDLTSLNAVVVDKEAGTVTLSGGAQIKDAVAPLYAAGLCAPFGTANTVGAIPQGWSLCRLPTSTRSTKLTPLPTQPSTAASPSSPAS